MRDHIPVAPPPISTYWLEEMAATACVATIQTTQNVALTQNKLAMGKNIGAACIVQSCHMQMLCFLISFLTLGAASLQTFSLIYKVVLVAQTPSIIEDFTAHRGGVVEVTLV